jgi:hypothetical protein
MGMVKVGPVAAGSGAKKPLSSHLKFTAGIHNGRVHSASIDSQVRACVHIKPELMLSMLFALLQCMGYTATCAQQHASCSCC